MPFPELRERQLAGLSSLQVRYFLAPATRFPVLQILVIQYGGTFSEGAAAHDDVQYLLALAKAGVVAFEPCGVIHDFSDFGYKWGERLDQVLKVGPDKDAYQVDKYGTIFPTNLPPPVEKPAVVIGPRCEDGFRKLILGKNSSKAIDSAGNIFRDLASAWHFIDSKVGP
jgi:hypothetical protein